MFCFQCQEAANGKGCTKLGVCGKTSSLAELQDILIYITKEISSLGTYLDMNGIVIEEMDRFIVENLFMTVTNANFDEERFMERIRESLVYEETIKEVLRSQELLEGELEGPLLSIDQSGEIVVNRSNPKLGVLAEENEDLRSLKELIIYGLKGIAAYYEHVLNMGYEDPEILQFIRFTLSETLRDGITEEELIGLTLKTGSYGVNVMALLDRAHNETFGMPEITEVEIGVGTRPGILISGHDLVDFKELLEQSKDSGVDIYTHGEMLPGHYYPELKKYDHLVGNYGNAWWKQREEFESFNGPILFTTNCIVPPKDSYKDKVFTTGSSGYPGFKHIVANSKNKKDFSELIELAKKQAPPRAIEEGKIVGGFGHGQVSLLADDIVRLVKEGKIRKFVVMAGCDGRMKSRDYYEDFAKSLAKDTVILTAGCAKYRYNKLDLGDIEGVPRVLDAGQCNDSFSLVMIALKLKEAFGLDNLNDLPIVYNIAWYEQKAVIVLLALLYLGVKNIHLGPSLPAFLSENIVDFLVENFGIAGIGQVEEDIKAFGL